MSFFTRGFSSVRRKSAAGKLSVNGKRSRHARSSRTCLCHELLSHCFAEGFVKRVVRLSTHPLSSIKKKRSFAGGTTQNIEQMSVAIFWA